MSDFASNVAVRKGSVLLDQGRYKEAAQIFQQQLAHNPNDGQLLHLLSFCQYHIPGQNKKALETVELAIVAEPHETYHYELKALILVTVKKLAKALEVANYALSLDPQSAQAHAVKAYVFIQWDKWSEAEQSARVALEINADHTFASNLLATALNMQNKTIESAHLTADLLAKDPDDYSSHTNAGWVYMNQGDYKKAQIHFKEALRLDPTFDPARIGMLETFKAKSAFYRVYLKYIMFMSRQKVGMRWAIIIGVYFLLRFLSKYLKSVTQGPFVLVGYAAIAVIYFFFFWTWLSRGLGNLIVLKDKFARHALKRNEKLDAIFVGGLFIGGLMMCLVGILFSNSLILFSSIGLILSTIPFASTFINEHKTGRWFYGSIGVLVIFAGVVVAFYQYFDISVLKSFSHILTVTALIAFIISTWLGAFGFLHE